MTRIIIRGFISVDIPADVCQSDWEGRNVIMARVTRNEVIKKGVSFGTALAIAISWYQHQSILWAIIHGLLSWLYVIYYMLTR